MLHTKTGPGRPPVVCKRGGRSLGPETHPPQKILIQNLAEGKLSSDKRPFVRPPPAYQFLPNNARCQLKCTVAEHSALLFIESR